MHRISRIGHGKSLNYCLLIHVIKRVAIITSSLSMSLAMVEPVAAQSDIPGRDLASKLNGRAIISEDLSAELLGTLFTADIEGTKRVLAKMPQNGWLPTGEPAVVIASRYGSESQLKLFLDAGDNANARAPDGWTPLFSAIAADRPDSVRLLLAKGADPAMSGEDGSSPVAFAEAIGNAEVIWILRRAISDVIPKADALSLLRRAAAEGKIGILQPLAKEGGDVDAADELGWTSLMYAAASGQAGSVRALLDMGAKSNHVAQNGITPLMVAAAVSNQAVVEILLAAGAVASSRNTLGQTAGTIAMANGDDDLGKVLGSTATPATLHQRVAAAAARRDRGEVLRLLDLGAPAARTLNASSDTPAIVAAACAGDASIVELLVQRGARVEEKDPAGVTPLLASVLCDQPDAVRSLLQLKAVTQGKTKDGIDVSSAAIARANPAVMALVNPSTPPSIETAVQVLQRKDMKTLAAILRINEKLGLLADDKGPILFRQALLLNDSTVLEQLMAMTNYNANYKASSYDKTPLVYALEAGSIQSVRTLLKLGAQPTQVVSDNPPTIAFDVATKLRANEAIQAMSQAAKAQILAMQAEMVTVGLLKTADGSWGPATQSAWDNVKQYLRRSPRRYAEDAMKDMGGNLIRVCNQTGSDAWVAHYRSDTRQGTKLTGWAKLENAECRHYGSIDKSITHHFGVSGRALAGSRTKKLCTTSEAMNEEDPAKMAAPCRQNSEETTFVEMIDTSKPFIARFP